MKFLGSRSQQEFFGVGPFLSANEQHQIAVGQKVLYTPPSDTRGPHRSDHHRELDTPSYQILENTVCGYIHRVPKNQAPKLWQQLCQILTDFKNSFTDRLSRKLAIQRFVDIPPHLTYVATLPSETWMTEKSTKFTVFQKTNESQHSAVKYLVLLRQGLLPEMRELSDFFTSQ